MTEDRPLDEQVLHRVEDGVAWITLNRPEAHNAITPDQRDRVIWLLSEASAELAVRCVVHHRHRQGVLHRRRPAGVAAGPAPPRRRPRAHLRRGRPDDP